MALGGGMTSEAKREVFCADAIPWMTERGRMAGACAVTSLPDVSEVGVTLEVWRAWFSDAVKLVVAAVPDERMEHALIPVFDAAVDRELVDSVIELYHARCPGFRRLGAAVVLDPLPRGPLGKPMMREILALLDALKSKGA